MFHMRLRWFVVAVALLAVAFAIPGVAEAQGSERKLKVGGKGGWTYATIRGDAVTDEEVNIDFGGGNGFSLGGVVAAQVHPNVTIQPEFLYTNKVVKADFTIEGVAATGEINSDYFEIPVLVKLHGSDRPPGFAPFALVGTTFSFLVNAEQTAEAAGMTARQDIKDELTGTDVGLTFGGGVDFIQDWGVVTVDGRYTLGLRTLDESGVDDVKVGSFQVMAGVVF